MKREDYLKVLDMLQRIDKDLNMYETKNNEDLISATRKKISIIQNLLSE
jgi:hypothetical protein